MTYGTRTCLQCGKSFIAAYPSQITYGHDCRKARIKELDRKWHLLHGKASKPDDLDWANARLEAALVKINGLEMAADALKKETTVCQNAVNLAGELLKKAEKPKPPSKAEKQAAKLAAQEAAKKAAEEKEEREAIEKTAKDKKKRYRLICKNCGNVFYSVFDDAGYCSEQCFKEARAMGIF